MYQRTADTRDIRQPILGAIGHTGRVGLMKARGTKHRPTGDQLMKMSEGDFAAFIRASGLKTVTTANLVVPSATKR